MLRMATKESSEQFSELPLFELKDRYNKTAEGRKFLQESIIDRHSAACLALALDECFYWDCNCGMT